MSGPKSSRYTLTSEQRRILAEQRKLEQRKKAALESIKRNHKNLLRFNGMFSSAKQIAEELSRRNMSDNGFKDKLCDLENLIAPIASIISETDKNDADLLEKTAEKVAQALSEAEKTAGVLSAISAKNEIELHTSLNIDIDKGFGVSFADIQTDHQASVSRDREMIKVQLTETRNRMRNCRGISSEWVRELEGTLSKIDSIEDETFLKNYCSLTVSPLLKRCKMYLDEYESCHEEFEKLYAEYIALCDLYFYTPQEYLCCNDSIEALGSEIRRIKKAVDADDEQAYISDCLDEVMDEMGYTVIGSREVTKKNGKHFHNELYTYGEGTAVNVTYSSDGKIAMEIGGIDSNDRLPNDREASVLCETMEHFCDDFKEIEKRLLAKGIILAERISLLPPTAEYAQIINTTDYLMTEKSEALQINKRHRIAAWQKTLRKE